MALRLFKYELEFNYEQIIMLPYNALFLEVKNQYEKPVLYAIVDPESERFPFNIRMHSTGDQIVHTFKRHLGTVLFKGGDEVYHFFQY